MRPIWKGTISFGLVCTLKIYSGASHGVADTHKDQLNADLLSFIRARDAMSLET